MVEKINLQPKKGDEAQTTERDKKIVADVLKQLENKGMITEGQKDVLARLMPATAAQRDALGNKLLATLVTNDVISQKEANGLKGASIKEIAAASGQVPKEWMVMPGTIVDKVDELVKKGKVKENDRNYLLEAVKATYHSYVTDGMAEDKAAEKMLTELKNTEERKEMVAVQKKEMLKQKTPKPTEKEDLSLAKESVGGFIEGEELLSGMNTDKIIEMMKKNKVNLRDKNAINDWLSNDENQAKFFKLEKVETPKPIVKEATISEMLDKKDAQNTVVGSPVNEVAEKVTVKEEKEALIKALTELSEAITALTTGAKEAHPEEVSNRPWYTYVPIVGELAQLIFPSEGAKWSHKVPIVGWFMNIFSPPKAKDPEAEIKRIGYVNERLPESVPLTLGGKEQNVNFYLDAQKTVMMRTAT